MSKDDVNQDIEKIYDIRYNFYKNTVIMFYQI